MQTSRTISVEEFSKITVEVMDGTTKGLKKSLDIIAVVSKALSQVFALLNKEGIDIEKPSTRDISSAMLANEIVNRLKKTAK